MAGFVERSDDAEMKEFYAKNIVPFIQNALVKNELLDKLKLLQDEHLKYFLYYKLMEKIESGVPIGLELSSSAHLEAGYGRIVSRKHIFFILYNTHVFLDCNCFYQQADINSSN